MVNKPYQKTTPNISFSDPYSSDEKIKEKLAEEMDKFAKRL